MSDFVSVGGISVMARGVCLLIVEDEALIAMGLEDMLNDLGHSVVAIASTVDRALALIDEPRLEFDAVLVDANLRGHSSLPVAQALRNKGTPFLIISGYSASELSDRGFKSLNIRKPVHRHELMSGLESLLRPRD